MRPGEGSLSLCQQCADANEGGSPYLQLVESLQALPQQLQRGQGLPLPHTNFFEQPMIQVSGPTASLFSHLSWGLAHLPLLLCSISLRQLVMTGFELMAARTRFALAAVARSAENPVAHSYLLMHNLPT